MSNAIKQQSRTFVEYGHRTEYAFSLLFSAPYLYFVTILIGPLDRVVGTHAHRNYIWYLVSAKTDDGVPSFFILSSRILS